jgi:hypothetical protein
MANKAQDIVRWFFGLIGVLNTTIGWVKYTYRLIMDNSRSKQLY